MYEFIDTIESSEGTSLPSEAVKINGEYIENQIEGYRTLTVEGREALSPEISFFETGIRDGSVKKSKRYPARTIRITYQLIAQTNEEFRAAYNKLGQILDVEDAELIFNDEQDKFFKGTPSYIGEVPPGSNAVIGEFEILCLDPFKYSVAEYEAEPDLDSGSILIDYNGTYKSFPTLRAEFYKEDEASEDGASVKALTGNGDCGYVAFFNEEEKIIQLGDPDEVDGETAYEKSQTLINQSFEKSNSWGTAAQSLWRLNSGVTSSDAVKQTGTLKMGAASFTNPMPAYSDYFTILTASSTANEPTVNYKVMACYDKRTTNSVRVTVSVRASLAENSNYIGKGYVIKAKVSIGGQTHTLNIKTSDYYWRGTAALTRSFTTTLSVGQYETTLTGITFEAYRDDNTGGTAGTLAATRCSNIKIAAYPVPEPDTYYLTNADYGSGTDWHGAGITRAIPADAAGVVGAVNFKLSYSQKMCIGSGSGASNQLGAFQVLLVDASKKVIAGVNVYKGGSGKTAKLRFYVNSTVVETTEIDLSYNNNYFKKGKQSSITKSGQTVTFNISGISRTFRDEAIATAAVTEMTITMTKFGTKTPLEYNGLYWVKFVKDNCDTWRNIPNKFSANDVVEADCKNGEVYLNGVSAPAYGALGNDWEGFFLTPGLNQIGFSYSEWVEAACAPSFKVRYREVFL
jgi:predicted phage tail component-like protein